MTTELQGVYMDTSVVPWVPFANENIRAYSTKTGTLEGNANTDANGRFILFGLTNRNDWVPVCTSRNSGVVIIDALDQADLLRLLTDTDLSVGSLESAGFVSVDGEALNYVDDYDALVDQDYLGSSPTVYGKIVDAKDEFPISIWVRNPGDTADVDFLSTDDTQRLAGKDADTVIIPVNVTLNRPDFTIVEVGFDAKALTFSAARQQARDVLFTAAGYLAADAGASLCAAERCRFHSNTGIPIRVAGGASSLLFKRPFFTGLTATVDHCIDFEGAVDRMVVDFGIFLTVPDVYHIGSTVTGAGVTESKFLNSSFLLTTACGGIDLYGSRNAIGACDFLALTGPIGGQAIRLDCPAGTNIDTEVSTCRFIAANAADVMFSFEGADGDGKGLILEHCKAPNGGTFKGSQDMTWHGNDLRNCTIDFRSKTGQRVNGGDMTGATLQNIPSDIVFRGVKGQNDRGDIQGTYDKLIDIGAAMVQATAPSTPADGQIWLDTSTSGTGTETLALTTKTANYTATDSDDVILCDATAGAITITLPTAVGRTGKVFHVKKIDATANIVTIDGDGTETIDGATTQVLSTQYNAIKIISDGSEWHIL